MPTAIVTGSGGLIGSSVVRVLVEHGFDVVGIENDSRAGFFGAEASTAPVTRRLLEEHPPFRSMEVDVRDDDAVGRVFRECAETALVVHTGPGLIGIGIQRLA